MRPESERRVERWYAQRWILDNLTAERGIIAIAGGVLNVIIAAAGPDVSRELRVFGERVKKFDDIKREATKVAKRKEELAVENEAGGHDVSARDNFFVASLMYGFARWTIWEDNNEDMPFLNEKVVTNYSRYMIHAPHYVEKVAIPFEGGTLYGLLHLPGGKTAKVPCLVSIPGMDNYKEMLVRLNGDKYLDRGIAVLALDGPGQGETRCRGVTVSVDNFERAGTCVLDYLAKRDEIDSGKIGLKGRSFGTYWGPRMMAADDRFKAGAFVAVCHETGMKSIFGSASPVFKMRHMWIAGYDNEGDFDKNYSGRLTLEGVGPKIKSPIIMSAGENDELSPIGYTLDFFKTIAGPKKLIVHEGEGHGVTDSQTETIQADFISDALQGNPPESELVYVDAAGRTQRRWP